MAIVPDPVTKLAGNGYAYTFKPNDNGTIGVDYYYNGQPISNSQWGGDISASDLEKAASMNYRSYDDYLLDNGGVTSDRREDPQIGPSAINTSDRREDLAPTPTPTSTINSPSANYADESAYYQDQLDMLNRLLGRVDTQQNTGRTNIANRYETEKTNLGNLKTRTMNEYGEQDIENTKDREQGLGQVGSFLNTSYNSLMRLLGGAGAGVSSVAREVVPRMVSKSGSVRRAGVFDTFGRNAKTIDSARTDATDQYTNSENELNRWKEDEENKLNTNSENERINLLGQRRGYEINQGRLNDPGFLQSLYDSGQSHTGYSAARATGSATQEEINRRMANLDALFGTPSTYTPKTITTQSPELSKYTVDPGTINADQNISGENRYYLPLLRKRQTTIV